jgi:hypothetical protein
MTDDVPARRSCGTMEVHQRLIDTDPAYRANRVAIESFTKGFARGRVLDGAAFGPPRVHRIPVVVHVLYHTAGQNLSDAQIRSQIDVLNADFRRVNADVGQVPSPFRALAGDACIEFALATRDPLGQPTSGITRTQTANVRFDARLDDAKRAATGGHDAWRRDWYLNVWTVPQVVDPAVGSLLGYAQFPGGDAAADGVVVLHSAFGATGTATAPFDRGRTTTHEVGHWLNLLHIWGDDGMGCVRSDEIGDTPNQAGPNAGRPVFPTVSCQNGPHGDMFMNYMDYVDDASMCMFTAEQVVRMRSTLEGSRQSLLSSPGLAPMDTAAKGAENAGFMAATAFNGAGEVFDGVRWLRPADLPEPVRGVFRASRP